MNVDLLAYLASTLSAALLLPQAVRTWQMRHDSHALRGVSIGTPVVALASCGLWLLWANEADQWPAVAYVLVEVPAAAMTIALAAWSRFAQEQPNMSVEEPHTEPVRADI